MIKIRKNTLLAIIVGVFFIGTAFGYTWHFCSNRWASQILYYYFYGQERNDIPVFEDKEKGG